jgi:membrane-bound lytic murein transglycosylase D
MKLKSVIYISLFSVLMHLGLTAQPLRPDDPIAAALDSLDMLKFFQNSSFSADREKLNIYKFPPDSIPVYSEDTYRKRMSKLDALSPFGLVYNESVKAYIDLYARNRRTLTSRMLGLSQLYFPLYEEKLANYGLPLELKYLSIIESALNPTAKSKAGAGGLWQFMYRTGLNYNLNVNSYVDDRFNPELSTDAACRLLKNLHGMYKDWSLALAAYNAGPGNVNKAIRRAGGAMDYWSIRPYLPQETQGYVPAFIAVTYVMSHHAEHNIFPAQPKYFNYEIDSVYITANVTFEQISKIVSVPQDDIRFLNPMYLKGVIPGSARPYPLYLPRKAIGEFMANERLLYKTLENTVVVQADSAQKIISDIKEEVSQVPTEKKQVSYTVQKGDYISLIARKFQVKVSEIMEWNNLKSETLFIGQKLTIFSNETVVQTPPPVAPKPAPVSPSQYKYYTVRSGDTLYGIALKYKVTVAEIMKWNNLRSKTINVGQKIKIKTG